MNTPQPTYSEDEDNSSTLSRNSSSKVSSSSSSSSPSPSDMSNRKRGHTDTEKEIIAREDNPSCDAMVITDTAKLTHDNGSAAAYDLEQSAATKKQRVNDADVETYIVFNEKQWGEEDEFVDVVSDKNISSCPPRQECSPSANTREETPSSPENKNAVDDTIDEESFSSSNAADAAPIKSSNSSSSQHFLEMTEEVENDTKQQEEDGEEEEEEEEKRPSMQDFRRNTRSSSNALTATTTVLEEQIKKKTMKEENKIQVGVRHQAKIPPLARTSPTADNDDKEQTNINESPTLCWFPGTLPDNEINDYLSEAATILKHYIIQQGLEDSILPVPATQMFNPDTTHRETYETTSAGESIKPILFREIDQDKLLSLLHTCQYQPSTALTSIHQSPKTYLTLWTPQEQKSFALGFRKYCGSIRIIYKNNILSSKFTRNKTIKDVIDYFYRFKIPDQFRKYMEKKREFSRYAMEQILLDGKLWAGVGASSIEDGMDAIGGDTVGPVDAIANGDIFSFGGGPGSNVGNKRIRGWIKAAKATNQRRSNAKDFLLQVRERLGDEKYLVFSNYMKSYTSTEGDNDTSRIPMLHQKIFELLQPKHDDLYEQFLEFLPKER